MKVPSSFLFTFAAESSAARLITGTCLGTVDVDGTCMTFFVLIERTVAGGTTYFDRITAA